MTTKEDGTTVCDSCGGDVGNGGVSSALVLCDLDPRPDRPGSVRNLHLCRDRLSDDGQSIVKGCAVKVVDVSALAWYKGNVDSSNYLPPPVNGSDVTEQAKQTRLLAKQKQKGISSKREPEEGVHAGRRGQGARGRGARRSRTEGQSAD